MLYSNDVFLLDGVHWRLLRADSLRDTAWVIDVDTPTAWPENWRYSELEDVERVVQAQANVYAYSDARLKRCNEAWARLRPLVEDESIDLYEPTARKQALKEHAAKSNCSVTTLYKDLRRYFQRGQTKFALMPDYDRSGRPSLKGDESTVPITAGRGRKPKHNYDVYQLTREDVQLCKTVIEQKYLPDARITVQDAYEELIRRHYRFEDGNGIPCVKPLGDRPTIRQFRRILHSEFNIETRLRSRLGDSDFERDHRSKLGTILQDCRGVGHYYEIDATIADVYLVSSDDPTKIIGKPTLYLIIDRKSRLIVGVYFGLENASWNGAMQAILSISEDKRALCQRYGVDYHPEDWPAHEVFPSEFLADRGDMISHASSSIAEGLHVTVTNLPSKRPDWKPLVECGFKQIHSAMRPLAPAYDPPSNATRRRGKHYEKDACLTMADFGNLLLNTIVKHNQREILNYPLSTTELLEGVRPSPIALWNHGIVSQAGILTRYAEETVRFALLRKKHAVVSERGIEFEGCFYSFPHAIERKWFETARKRHFSVTVSYDPRLVDTIYVHPPEGKGEPHIATLTERSRGYQGKSFDEVAYYEALRAAVRHQSEQSRLENRIGLNEATSPTISAAKQKLKGVGKASRSARRADTKQTREQERAMERRRLAKISGGLDSPSREESAIPAAQGEAKPTADSPKSVAELVAQAKRRMRA